MMHQLIKLPVSQCAVLWPEFSKYVTSVAKHAQGEWTADQLKADIFQGRVQVILFWNGSKCDGAMTYVMQNRRNSRIAFIISFGGHQVTTAENWTTLKMIFKNDGATAVEAAARQSAARLWSKLGFQPKYQVIEVSI